MKFSSVFTLTIVLVVGLSCKKLDSLVFGGNQPFTVAADKFSINFPGGSSGIETDPNDGLKATGPGTTYGKSFDNRSDNYRSYEVTVYSLSPAESEEHEDILRIGLNGWDDEPETTVKKVNVGGQNALDSVRTIELGPVKMTFREVVFWNVSEKKLYVVKVAASKQENVATTEANDFVNSFRFTS